WSQAVSLFGTEKATDSPPKIDPSSFEKAALSRKGGGSGVQLSLHLSDNNLDTQVQNVSSGVGLIVWDDESDVSGLTMASNQLHTQISAQAPTQAPTLPSSMIAGLTRCTVTGNVVVATNKKPENLSPPSLYLFSVQGTETAAVTGNVLQGKP